MNKGTARFIRRQAKHNAKKLPVPRAKLLFIEASRPKLNFVNSHPLKMSFLQRLFRKVR